MQHRADACFRRPLSDPENPAAIVVMVQRRSIGEKRIIRNRKKLDVPFLQKIKELGGSMKAPEDFDELIFARPRHHDSRLLMQTERGPKRVSVFREAFYSVARYRPE